MTYPRWEPEAEEYLAGLVGTVPPCDLHRLFNLKAKSKGWTIRSYHAFRVRAKRLAPSVTPDLDNFNPSELARTLNIPRDRTQAWVERGLLKHRILPSGIRAIKLKDFQQFAKTHFRKLAGCDREGLEWLLEDVELVNRICALPSYIHGQRQKVKRADTGETFSSIKEAARRSYVDRRGIKLSVVENRQVSGIKWEAV